MKVEAIYVYPIKSLRGVSLQTAQLTALGFPQDRRFMLVRDHGTPDLNPKKNGTQYEGLHIGNVPSMCLFTTSLISAASSESGIDEIEVTHKVPANGSNSSIRVPLVPDVSGQSANIFINMHQSCTTAYRMPQSDWFADKFGFPVLLLYLGPSRRPVLGNFAPNAALRNPIRRRAANPTTLDWMWSKASRLLGYGSTSDEDYEIGFADCAPYLLATTESLDEISNRLPDGTDMDMTKFRPNIVVSGADSAFDEDFWGQVTFKTKMDQEVVMHLTANCVRCASITVDYKTGEFGTDVAGQHVFKKMQKDRRVDAGVKWSPVFGRYGFVDRDIVDASLLSIGDEVEVTKTNAERTAVKWPGSGKTPKDDLYAL